LVSFKIYFVTGNKGKFEEAKEILGRYGIKIEMKHIPYPEVQAETLREVVDFGLKYLQDKLSKPFFVEDSGLFIEALKGFPGVYSAYVFKTIGNNGILKLMENVENRNAKFISVVGYFDGKNKRIFEGAVNGRISHSKRGGKGFGFDPIFIPENYNNTFAELGSEKNKISHRYKALKKLGEYLKNAEKSQRKE